MISCGQERGVTLAEQSELLAQDPLITEYFESIAASAKIIREGDIDLENYAKAICRPSILSKKINDKHSFIKDLNKNDKKELFAPLVVEPVFDEEFVKEKAIRKLNEQLK